MYTVGLEPLDSYYMFQWLLHTFAFWAAVNECLLGIVDLSERNSVLLKDRRKF